MPPLSGKTGIKWKSGNSPEDFVDDLRSFRSALMENLAVEFAILKEAGVAIAKQYAPVETGELRDSIEGAVKKMAKVVIIQLKAGADHAPHQEFGTIYQSGKPFIRPAMNALAPMVVKRVSDAWDRAAKSV